MNFKRISGLVLLTGLVSLLLAACGDPTATTTAPTKSVTTAATTTAATAATTTTATTAAPTSAAVATLPPGAKAVKSGPDTKESKLLQTVTPHITATLDALKKGDVAAAKKAFQEYVYVWNGIEVYVNARSKSLYNTIEVENEFKATELFEKPDAKAADILPYVEGVQKGFAEAIKLAQTGPDYDAILDEIADLRIVRVDLRKSIAALTASDIATAKTGFEKFDKGWDTIESSVKPRSKELYKETEKWIDKVNQLYKADKPVAATLAEAENNLLTAFNRSVTMLNTIRTTGKVPTKEVILMQAVPASISNTLALLKKGDVKAAQTAFQEYSNGWNGIEVYVKTRSAQLYDTIEVQNEFKANELFEKAGSKAEQIIPFVEGVQKGYTDAINLALNGQPLNPILDEIADVRILRISLKKTITALKDNNIAAAKAAFQEFDDGWTGVGQSISSRSKDLSRDIETKITKVGGLLLRTDKPVVAEVSVAADELQTSYNSGLKLLTDAVSSGNK